MPKKQEIMYLIIDTVENIDNIENIRSRAVKIADFIIAELSQGKLLEKQFLYSYVIFQKVKLITDNSVIDNLIKNLSELARKYSDNSFESFLLNDNIFLLETIKGNLEHGFKNYIKNILSLDFHKGINEQYADFLPKMLSFFLIDKGISKNFYYTIKTLLHDYLQHKKKTRRSILNWIWQCLWPARVFLQKRDEVTEFYPLFKEILYKLIEKEKVDEVMLFSMFIFNISINVIVDEKETYEKLQKEINSPCQELYKKWIEKNKNRLKQCKSEIDKNQKIKIAIVRPHIGYWSPFKIEYSLAKSLINSPEFIKKYELFFYSFDSIDLWAGRGDDPKCIKMLKDADIPYLSPVKSYNDKYGYYTNYLNKVLDFRNQIISDNIDIIIYSDHLYSIGEFLFLARTAPKQIYWSHGNYYYHIKNTDLKISNDKPKETVPYSYKIFEYTMDKHLLIGTNEEKEEGEKIKKELLKKFGKSTVILGTIGRLTKLNNDDYIKTVATILKENPNTIYLACGNGEKEEILEKTDKHQIRKDRFIFTGFVNPHVYGWVIDIFLNPFPMTGGQALDEYRMKDKLFIAFNSKQGISNNKKLNFFDIYNDFPENIRKLYSSNYLENLKTKGYLIEANKKAKFFHTLPLVSNRSEYINMANLLINNKKLGEKIIAEIVFLNSKKTYQSNLLEVII